MSKKSKSKIQPDRTVPVNDPIIAKALKGTKHEVKPKEPPVATEAAPQAPVAEAKPTRKGAKPNESPVDTTPPDNVSEFPTSTLAVKVSPSLHERFKAACGRGNQTKILRKIAEDFVVSREREQAKQAKN